MKKCGLGMTIIQLWWRALGNRRIEVEQGWGAVEQAERSFGLHAKVESDRFWLGPEGDPTAEGSAREGKGTGAVYG
jgi:hypothetical protein